MLDFESNMDKTPPNFNEIQLFGDTDLQERLNTLCEEYNDVFGTSLGPTPATVPEMDILVDTVEWEKPTNCTPPRLQTLAKEAEIVRQTNLMLEAGIIVESHAPYYSHVMLAPKPGGKWRFCIDYRKLNAIIKSIGWPIPNIKQTLLRIGRQHATIFGIIDLTSGYHQITMTKQSRVYTAFITPQGIYEFTRVPFGLKGSPAFFQRTMMTVVLKGLIPNICEVYLDDILIFARTKEEFLDKIRNILKRFRQFNIKANPAKTRLGLNEVEYLGHTINQKGVDFSTEKKNSVLLKPLPKTEKKLQQFLGT